MTKVQRIESLIQEQGLILNGFKKVAYLNCHTDTKGKCFGSLRMRNKLVKLERNSRYVIFFPLL